MAAGVGGLAPHCKECQKKRLIKYRYGLSADQYESMLNEQNGYCLICEELMHMPFVDHCHNSLDVRGMLCKKCNSIIGYANDDINVLKNAIEYLENRNGRN